MSYYQTLINIISTQYLQMSANIQKYQSQKNITDMYFQNINNDTCIPVFSRVTSDVIAPKCNFCSKPSYYTDMENKFYCWFHRSQFEEEN